MLQIRKEIVETVAAIKEEFRITSDKEAIDLAIKMQKNRMIRDLTDTIKTKV